MISLCVYTGLWNYQILLLVDGQVSDMGKIHLSNKLDKSGTVFPQPWFIGVCVVIRSDMVNIIHLYMNIFAN